MIIIDETLISDELYTEQFVCDLPVCHGGCCVHGDAGAPLEKKETIILDRIFESVKPYMRQQGIESVEKLGRFVEDVDCEYTTPLVDGKECAYVFFDDDNIAKCAIEKAWEEKQIDFKKPLSCHLYPVRIENYTSYDAINYHRWPICDCARKKGKKLQVPVYTFIKDALIRKYGENWYTELSEYVKYIKSEEK